MTILKQKFEKVKHKDKWLALRSESVRIFNDLKLDGMSNLEIINCFNVVHFYCSKDYPYIPNDNETKFLIFSELYKQV